MRNHLILSVVVLLLTGLWACSGSQESVETTQEVSAPDPEPETAESEEIQPVEEPEITPDQPYLALSLVIDKSGSMSGQPMDLAREAARASSQVLDATDLIHIVVFDAQATTVLGLTPGGERAVIDSAIDNIAAGGGTNLLTGLDAAHQALKDVEANRRHVIVLSDGQTPTEGISELTETMANEGITVSSVALGPQADRVLLRNIADRTGGRFYDVRDPLELPRLFTEETRAVSRRVASQ